MRKVKVKFLFKLLFDKVWMILCMLVIYVIVVKFLCSRSSWPGDMDGANIVMTFQLGLTVGVQPGLGVGEFFFRFHCVLFVSVVFGKVDYPSNKRGKRFGDVS